ncbi:MAG TPA: hypothetical protein VN679_04085 [Candidatus Acidoferrales bacterium]|jgi:hypothetical protein|nr:hypothetical protein [Candidatus Angelobacter sp.]HWG86940.1 hypothetical protein [Candidatus Acidoferrales bacterium]
MKTILRTIFIIAFITLAGCRSRVVEVKLINTSQKPLSIIVVDYPGATFGVDKLDPGATYHYAIKPQSSGPLKIQFTDADGNNRTYEYPGLHKDDEGAITVSLDQKAATAVAKISGR